MLSSNDAEQAAALAQALRAILSGLKRRLRQQSHAGDVTPTQISALLRIEKDGATTASTLARAEGMRPQSIAPAIAALEQAGLISGAADPTDGRRTLLSLTDTGHQWIAERRAARQDWLTKALQSRLSPQERTDVETAITLLRRLVDD